MLVNIVSIKQIILEELKMTSIENKGRFFQAAKYLCPSLGKKILQLCEQLENSAQEIRLRVNRPISIVCTNITYYVTSSGGLTRAALGGSLLKVSKNDIVDTFQNICNYSVYTRQNEIINGFVTMFGGHRAGICGTAVANNGKITNIRDISSINIRIAREHKGCAKQLIDRLGNLHGGVLICGAPCSGKTTVLRDMARIMSTELCKNVSLIDERGELAGAVSGVFRNDVGMCDVYDSYKKSEAMIQAVRSMAPDIIICDEIGAEDDIYAVEQTVNSGVLVIATVHCANEYELKHKENMRRIFKTGAFSKVVFLSDKKTPGKVVKIIQAGDIFDA